MRRASDPDRLRDFTVRRSPPLHATTEPRLTEVGTRSARRVHGAGAAVGQSVDGRADQYHWQSRFEMLAGHVHSTRDTARHHPPADQRGATDLASFDPERTGSRRRDDRKGLRKSQTSRFATMEEFAMALEDESKSLTPPTRNRLRSDRPAVADARARAQRSGDRQRGRPCVRPDRLVGRHAERRASGWYRQSFSSRRWADSSGLAVVIATASTGACRRLTQSRRRRRRQSPPQSHSRAAQGDATPHDDTQHHVDTTCDGLHRGARVGDTPSRAHAHGWPLISDSSREEGVSHEA